jgi:competence protein ComEA
MSESKGKLWFLCVLAILVISLSTFNYWQKSSQEEAVEMTEANVSQVVVYVSGAVNSPGVIEVPAGARTLEAINRAGGLLPIADSTKINMAQLVKDGMQIHVPARPNNTTAGVVSSAGATSAAFEAKVNINTASAQELDKLPGIGPAIAEKIIQYRETHGNFVDIIDLKKVPGIGESKFNKLKDQITI